MPDKSSHHHSHHHEDYGSRFKRKGLSSISFRRSADKWMKIGLLILSVAMVILVVLAYFFV